MIQFALRNLRVYFKDKTSVFFSLMGVLMVIGLYFLFLGDLMVKSFEDIEGIRFLMDSWIMAGVIAITSITTALGAFGAMIEDRDRKINKDFIASPIKNYKLVGGYILSSFVIGLIMTLITLVLAEVYIVINGGELLSFVDFAKMLATILLTSLANVSIVLFITSFLSSMNAFATASSLIGTLIGFLTGIYLPMGNLPEAVQMVVKCFPVSHAAVLTRNIMLRESLATAFNGAPAEFVSDFEKSMGIRFYFGDTLFPLWGSVVVLAGTAVLFFGLSLIIFSRKKR